MKTNYHISQHEEAERRLLDAALQLVAERGLARMTLAEVGKLAGYSRTLPAHHFGNRAGLLKALIDHVHRILFDEVKTLLPRREGLEGILDLANYYLRASDEHTVAQRAVYALRLEALSGDPEVAQQMAGFYRRCENYVEAQLKLGIERGEIRDDIDPRRQTMIILGTLRGTLAQWLTDKQCCDMQLVRADAVESLRRALSANAAAKSRSRSHAQPAQLEASR